MEMQWKEMELDGNRMKMEWKWMESNGNGFEWNLMEMEIIMKWNGIGME